MFSPGSVRSSCRRGPSAPPRYRSTYQDRWWNFRYRELYVTTSQWPDRPAAVLWQWAAIARFKALTEAAGGWLVLSQIPCIEHSRAARGQQIAELTAADEAQPIQIIDRM